MKPESGTRGQNEFASWCEPEGFHVQRSDPDRLEWDFMLEADPERSEDIRSPGADISDFIDLAVEAAKRRRNIIRPVLIAGGIEQWSCANAPGHDPVAASENVPQDPDHPGPEDFVSA